ncbi:MAG TPA: hypothetical protein PKM28_09385, partial [Tenuifilaceae bacterium]|nr:hypothetical protein [Tenuifilaceae bacterium]
NPSDASYERNYGFAFEPGTYAIYLSVAILFNLLRTKVCLSVKENTRFYVLLLALITTFSTTGYIALGVIIIYLMFTEFKGLSKYFYLAAVVSFSIYLFVTVDFLYDKMEELFYGGRDVEELLYKAEETGFSYSAGRFGGFVIGWEDFKENPLFGRGGVSDLTVGVKGEGRVYIVNGMANIMSQFGVFGLAVFFIFLFKSSLMIAVEFDSRAYLITFFTFVIGIVAFAIHTQYILFTIMFCSFFVKSFSHCSLVVSPVFNVKQLHRQKF